MANANDVDAIQREKLLSGKRGGAKKPKTQPDWTPNKRTQKLVERMLKK